MALEIAPPKRDIPRASARRNDRDGIWRLAGWASSAMLALIALGVTTQAGPGVQRLDQLFGAAPPPPPVAQVTPRLPEKDPETLRLQAEVRALAADRERLVSRLAKLESHIEDVTGSIQRQVDAVVAPPPPAVTPPPAAAVPALAAPAVPVLDPLAMPLVTASATAWPENQSEPKPDEPPRAAPELRDVAVPPPARLAALPAQPAAAEPVTPTSPAKIEYGIDLGAAASMDALRERWSSVKANLGPLLTGLQPIAVRDRRPGSTQVHLVVGPMPNIAAARQVCSRFAAAKVACHPAKFDGEAIVQR